MKRMLLALSLCVLASAANATDVGVSISVGQPGFYGQIDIGNYPRPVLVYPQPVVIRPVHPGVVVAPMYLRVPPGHAKDWERYCGRYEACGRPVYFVQDSWYNNVYVPAYQEHHGKGNASNGKGKGKGNNGKG